MVWIYALDYTVTAMQRERSIIFQSHRSLINTLAFQPLSFINTILPNTAFSHEIHSSSSELIKCGSNVPMKAKPL